MRLQFGPVDIVTAKHERIELLARRSGFQELSDITEMAAQIPTLFETLSGMPFGELFAKVRRIGDNSSKPDDRTKGTGTGTGTTQ